jgi:hypothetical protein
MPTGDIKPHSGRMHLHSGNLFRNLCTGREIPQKQQILPLNRMRVVAALSLPIGE